MRAEIRLLSYLSAPRGRAFASVLLKAAGQMKLIEKAGIVRNLRNKESGMLLRDSPRSS
jgi:hypothetical protein